MLIVLFVSCKGDPESPGESPYETLTLYLSASEMDLSDVLSDWIIAASAVVENTSDYYIMDIRSAADYETGHIEGAVNSTLGAILTDAENNTEDKPILVACYTGQSAAHAVVALRLSDYADARVLKFGMSGWHSDFDKWTSNTGNIGTGHENWTTDATATLQDFDPPTFSASASDGAGILAERVDAMLAGGFLGIAATDVLTAPGDYFINNYWAEADVDHYGHIAGAYRIKEDLSIDAGGFMNLDPSGTIVTYCWTGQTSSVVTAYLTVLGYDAKSLKFGANAMIYDQLESGKWIESADYDYVSG